MKDTVIDSFLETVERFPNREALLFRANHHFESLTYEELYRYAQKLATYLKELSVTEGNRLVVISENRPEWVIVDLASMILGTILVPIHSVLAPSQMETIINEVEPAVIFVSDRAMLDKLLSIGDISEGVVPIGYFETDLPPTEPLTSSGRIFSFKNKVCRDKYEKILEPVHHNPDRVITIIYTSGTTGQFKGVELTNENFMSNVQGVLTWVEITENDKFLSILPLSHVFERTVGYYIPMVRGACISYVEDPGKLSEIAQAERPTIIIAVPRLFEKVYEAVKAKAEKSFIKKYIFRLAFAIGKKTSKKSLAYKLADRVVFRKVKEAFGGEIRFFVSGAASLAQEIGKFFDALNIPVLEGYGLTETSPIIATNSLEHRKYGTVGRVLENLSVKLGKNDELLVKGPSVFKRYYKNPEKTHEAFTADGYFKTGDLAEIDADGFVKFKARQKEILALSTGKKVSPAAVEERLQLTPAVAQAFVFGDGQKHVGALIVAEKEQVNGKTKQQLHDFIAHEIDKTANSHLAGYEQIKKFVIIKTPFSVENGLLTPTLKLRRPEIELKYARQIASIYEEI